MTNPYEDKLRLYIEANQIQAEHLSLAESCHSVAAAARAVGAQPEDLIKSICLIDQQGRLVVAIVKGEDRVSSGKVGEALGVPAPRMATPDEMLESTGYPCGGTPPFGFDAVFLIDPRVMDREFVYAGGGSESALIRLDPQELLRANDGRVVTVRQPAD